MKKLTTALGQMTCVLVAACVPVTGGLAVAKVAGLASLTWFAVAAPLAGLLATGVVLMVVAEVVL